MAIRAPDGANKKVSLRYYVAWMATIIVSAAASGMKSCPMDNRSWPVVNLNGRAGQVWTM